MNRRISSLGKHLNYKRVEYIESNGGSVANVGPCFQVPIEFDAQKDTMTFETCHAVDYSSGAQAEGSNRSSAMLFYGVRANGNSYFGQEGEIDSTDGVVFDGPAIKEGYSIFRVQTSPSMFSTWLNGTLIREVSCNHGNNFELKTISVFAALAHKTGQSSDYPFNGRKRYFKLWINHQLVINLIPVIDSLNVPCMYNVVNGQFFYNESEGEFKAGPLLGA